jgi:soluble lytic murein transglycosylase
MKFRRAILLVLIHLFLGPAVALALTADEQFLAARDAARAGDRARLERLASSLQGHELEPYVEYWQLLLDLKDSEPATVGAFLARHENTYVAEKLRTDWLRQLARKQQWAAFDAEFPRLAQPDQDLACYALQSRQAQGDASVLDAALPLWLTLLEPPEPCYPVLRSADPREARAGRCGMGAHPTPVRSQQDGGSHLHHELPASQPDAGQEAGADRRRHAAALAHQIAERFLGQPHAARTGDAGHPAHCAQRPARGGRSAGKIAPSLKAGEKAWAWSQIGWQAAQRHLPEAIEWYRQAGDVALSEEAAAWKVRAALRAQDWGSVRSTIERMPPALAAQPAWVYWLGRAYRAGGRLEEANALFARIAGQPDFYGSLANDELGRTTMTPPKASPPSREELLQVSATPAVQRAQAFFRLNLRTEGVREWNWALRSMSDRELLAASEIARRAGNYDRAIAAADRTRTEHDYSLRYLAPYGDQVRPAAQNQALDDAWVYGLMRQESRFVSSARSHVGASGLMQLMPATAKVGGQQDRSQGFPPGQGQRHRNQSAARYHLHAAGP